MTISTLILFGIIMITTRRGRRQREWRERAEGAGEGGQRREGGAGGGSGGPHQGGGGQGAGGQEEEQVQDEGGPASAAQARPLADPGAGAGLQHVQQASSMSNRPLTDPPTGPGLVPRLRGEARKQALPHQHAQVMNTWHPRSLHSNCPGSASLGTLTSTRS